MHQTLLQIVNILANQNQSDVLIEKELCGYIYDWNPEQEESRYSCPRCDSEYLSLERDHVIDGQAIQLVACHRCNLRWKDKWGLSLSYKAIWRQTMAFSILIQRIPIDYSIIFFAIGKQILDIVDLTVTCEISYNKYRTAYQFYCRRKFVQ